MGWGNESLIKRSRSLTKLAAMPIYCKTLKNLLLRNQRANDIETWYAASGAQVLPSCSNEDPGLTLIYFATRSNSHLNTKLS